MDIVELVTRTIPHAQLARAYAVAQASPARLHFSAGCVPGLGPLVYAASLDFSAGGNHSLCLDCSSDVPDAFRSELDDFSLLAHYAWLLAPPTSLDALGLLLHYSYAPLTFSAPSLAPLSDVYAAWAAHRRADELASSHHLVPSGPTRSYAVAVRHPDAWDARTLVLAHLGRRAGLSALIDVPCVWVPRLMSRAATEGGLHLELAPPHDPSLTETALVLFDPWSGVSFDAALELAARL